MDQLYKIVELETTGWEDIDPQYHKLTKEQAMQCILTLIEDGYNPNRIRAVVDND
jgi:hypothetical protein